MDWLFQNVLSMSLSAGFLAAVVMGLRWFFRSSPKWVHCALWALVAVRLLCPSLPRSEYSMVPQRVSDPQRMVEVMEEMPAFVPMPTPEMEPMAELPRAEIPAAPAPVEEIQPVPAARPINYMEILGWIWAGGVCIMGGYAIFSYLRLRRRVAASVDLGNRVFLCDYIGTPFILGLVKPRIYLPSQLDSKTAGFVLAHEQAHLRRRDHWWKPFGFALLSIHWFNPMIWAAYILLCRDIEMACDEAVIRTMDQEEKMGYSGALLRCSLPRHLVSICPLAFGEVGVRERIKSVLHYRKPALWLTLAAVAAVIGAAVFFLTDPAGPAGEVEFYQTAYYNSSSDYLELTEYDKEFREIGQKEYYGGLLYNSSETTYRNDPASYFGKGRVRTVTYTVDPDSPFTICPESGIDVPPGESTTLIYHEMLDENGNVTDSRCNFEGLIFSFNAIYDGKGNKLNEAEEWEKNSNHTTCTYDENGNLLTKTSQWNRDSGLRDRTEKYTYDEQGRQTSYQLYYDGALEIDETSVWNDNGTKRSALRKTEFFPDSIYSYSYDETGLVETCDISWPDGAVYRQCITTYDEYGNVLSKIDRENGMEWRIYYNYIGTDGTKSIGIPKDIYTPGKEVVAHPAPNQEPEPRITIEARDVTPAGCILQVKISPRLKNALLSVGNGFTLERKNGDKWEKLEPLDHHFVQWYPRELGELPLVNGYYSADYAVSWSRLYGILPPGEYRLNTSLSNYYSEACSAKFTIEENESAVGEQSIQRCMNALNELISGQIYHVEIVDDQDRRDLYAQYSNHWLHLSYSSPTTTYPVGGQMMLGGTRYIKMQGAWAFNEEAPEKALTEWFEEFVFEHQNLELQRSGGKREIPFRVAYRPGRELPQKEHFITFCLDLDDHLVGIREEGVITEYNGQAVEQPYSRTLTVVSTEPEILEELIYPEEAKLRDKESCSTFSWEHDRKESGGGQFTDAENFVNKKPHPIEDNISQVYYLAKQELRSNLAVQYGIICRDEAAKMWRVEFRYVGGSGGYVYMDDNGVTQLVKMSYPADLGAGQVEEALEKCRAVLTQVQTAPCFGIETTFSYNNRSSTGERTIQSWVQDGDWLEIIKSPFGDVQPVRLFSQGQVFENDHGWGDQYQRFTGESAGSLGQFVPWLLSTRWENYDVMLLETDSVVTRFLMRPKAGDGDEFSAAFWFGEDGTFESARVETRHEGVAVSSQTTKILTMEDQSVRDRIDQQAALFAAD